MSEWIDANTELPEINRNVIAVGTWEGEIIGIGESQYMGLGKWNGSYIEIDSDTYSTSIIDVTHWMYIPKHPHPRR